MSQIPPPMPPSPNEPFDPNNANAYYNPYNYPVAKTSGMAMTSMILGILAIPLGCFGIGIILGIVALVLGIISLSAINKNPQQLGGKGFAITGIVTGAIGMIIIGPMLIAIMLPALGKARELSNRSVCAANVRGIVQSMVIYAADNDERYPIVAEPGGYGLAAAGSGTPAATPEATIASMYKGPKSPSMTQNMWLLVLDGSVAPRQFLCKSDPAPAKAASQIIGGLYATNFNDGTAPSDMAYSYSFACPWTTTAGSGPSGPIPPGSVGGWWRNSMDAGLPLMADMAPLEGTGTPAATPSDGRSRNANSFSHQRDGQNVGFGDAHAEFVRTPAAGEMNDNIYTGNGGVPIERGTPFSGKAPNVGAGPGPSGAWDTCLVPAADGNAGYIRK